jgi:hypothetical protein
MAGEKILLGEALFVQVQRVPLKVGERGARHYDPAGLERVSRLRLSAAGVTGVCANGEQVVDAHHRDHPQSRFNGRNGISVGFTAHYERMRAEFGAHLADGIAGENIIVSAPAAYAAGDLEGRLVFANPDGSAYEFTLVGAMAPCDEFSHFARRAGERLPAAVLKDTLQSLDGGRRGFAIALVEGESAQVYPGAKLWLAR